MLSVILWPFQVDGTPSVHLCSQVGTPPVFDDQLQAFLLVNRFNSGQQLVRVVGQFELQDSINSGLEAGSQVVKELGQAKTKAKTKTKSKLMLNHRISK